MCTYGILPLLLVCISAYSVGGTMLSFVFVVMQREMNGCQGTKGTESESILSSNQLQKKQKRNFLQHGENQMCWIPDERPVAPVSGSGCSHYCHYLAALDSQTKLRVMCLNPNRGGSHPPRHPMLLLLLGEPAKVPKLSFSTSFILSCRIHELNISHCKVQM